MKEGEKEEERERLYIYRERGIRERKKCRRSRQKQKTEKPISPFTFSLSLSLYFQKIVGVTTTVFPNCHQFQVTHGRKKKKKFFVFFTNFSYICFLSLVDDGYRVSCPHFSLSRKKVFIMNKEKVCTREECIALMAWMHYAYI